MKFWKSVSIFDKFGKIIQISPFIFLASLTLLIWEIQKYRLEIVYRESFTYSEIKESFWKSVSVFEKFVKIIQIFIFEFC